MGLIGICLYAKVCIVDNLNISIGIRDYCHSIGHFTLRFHIFSILKYFHYIVSDRVLNGTIINIYDYIVLVYYKKIGIISHVLSDSIVFSINANILVFKNTCYCILIYCHTLKFMFLFYKDIIFRSTIGRYIDHYDISSNNYENILIIYYKYCHNILFVQYIL